MSEYREDRAASFARVWRVVHPAASWALGSGLLVFVTLTGAGNQAAEWYALIGGLLGGPFLTLWKEARKQKNEADK